MDKSSVLSKKSTNLSVCLNGRAVGILPSLIATRRDCVRYEQEMMDLILSTAREDERIRAVYMNGSRTNPNAVKDIFQDFDIVYVVRETESFQRDAAWIDRFGVRLYMQYPEDSGDFPSDKHNCYGWLMQFADGNRLDLHVQRVEFSQKNILRDRLCIILLDKDNCLPEMPPSTDADFFVRRPTEKQFLDTCNEFWWCLNNVAKGLWRKEIPYAQDAGTTTDFACCVGKSGKYLYWFVPKEGWEGYLATYSSADPAECWQAAELMCLLFHSIARQVGQALGFHYKEGEAGTSFQFFRHVKKLPADAAEIL